MRLERIESTKTLGADLRVLRKTRGFTLIELADKVGRSVGWLSQVERGLSDPTLDDFKALSEALNAPMSILMGNNNAPKGEAGYVVRSGAGREIGRRVEGLTEQLLSPDLTDEFEVVHSVFEAGAHRDDFVTRPTQELGTILSGKLDIFIGEKSFTLGPGDSFRNKGEPFRWANPYEGDVIAIWVIAPPIY